MAPAPVASFGGRHADTVSMGWSLPSNLPAAGLSDEWIVVPAHALLVLEERLKVHQEEGLLDPGANVTELAITILLLSEAARLPAWP